MEEERFLSASEYFFSYHLFAQKIHQWNEINGNEIKRFLELKASRGVLSGDSAEEGGKQGHSRVKATLPPSYEML